MFFLIIKYNINKYCSFIVLECCKNALLQSRHSISLSVKRLEGGKRLMLQNIDNNLNLNLINKEKEKQS